MTNSQDVPPPLRTVLKREHTTTSINAEWETTPGAVDPQPNVRPHGTAQIDASRRRNRKLPLNQSACMKALIDLGVVRAPASFCLHTLLHDAA